MSRHKTFYDTPQWHRARLTQLARFPICNFAGCKVRANHVDHVQTLRAAWHRRLDPTNLQSLCEQHHNQLTNAYDRGRIAGVCDDMGNTLDPNHPWAQTSNSEAIAIVNSPKPVSHRTIAKLKARHMKPKP